MTSETTVVLLEATVVLLYHNVIRLSNKLRIPFRVSTSTMYETTVVSNETTEQPEKTAVTFRS